MKKLISLLLVLILCLSMAACGGKSEAVVKVEEQISAIGEVTLESKDVIESAQAAFDALPEEEKAEVENYYVLAECRKTLEALEEQEEQRKLEEKKKAEDALALQIYTDTKLMWETADKIGGGLYNVWHGWVYDKDGMCTDGLQFFADETELPLEEIIEGFAAYIYSMDYYESTGVSWNNTSAETKQNFRDYTIKTFEEATRNYQYVDMNQALQATILTYKLNGDMYNLLTLQESAKAGLKELPEDHANYADLKALYTTASGLADFVQSPSGNLSQFNTLLSDYRNKAREQMNVLSFTFE